MKSRTLHKLIGLVMTLPLLVWALTGVVFLSKPGYEGAYEKLSPRTYPLRSSLHTDTAGDWYESRLLKTTLGYHLLLKSSAGWEHFNPLTMEHRPVPSDADLVLLVDDAIAAKRDRYGTILSVSSGVVRTDTGVEITLDWNTMALDQMGGDTQFINALYKAHYVQWLPSSRLNVVLGAAAIVLLFLLVIAGLRNAFRKSA